MSDESKIEWHKPQVGGLWGFQIWDELPDDLIKFPPQDSHLVGMIGGDYEKCSKQDLIEKHGDLIKSWFEDGATHIMVGKGDACIVYERKEFPEL